MPQRSKKSRAAFARNNQQIQKKITKKENETMAHKYEIDPSDYIDVATGKENEVNFIHTNENVPVDALGIKYIRQVQGNFHQGNLKEFNYESAGVQCSCNALVMLCKVNRIYHNLIPQHLDDVLRSGDNLYKSTARKLEMCGELARDRTLENDQLPKTVVLEDYQYTIEYDILRYGTLDDERESDLDTLEAEINRSFAISERNILIFGGYMMALYRDVVTDQYLFFDSHSRDRFGYPSPDGTAVARIFPDIDSLIQFLHVLADNLNLNPRNFGIQPVIVTVTERSTHHQPVQRKHQTRTIMCASKHPHNEPGCSKWNSCNEPIQETLTFTSNFHEQSSANISTNENALNPSITDGSNRALAIDKIYASQPTSNQIKDKKDVKRLSRYQKWLNNLSTSKRNELLTRKRKSSNEYFACPQKAKRKRKQTEERYHQNPEIAARKREQARQQSDDTYKNPKKAESKRQQAKTRYHQNPEIAATKCEQAKTRYHQNPEIATRKREQARQQSDDTYKNPKKAESKRQQAKTRYHQNPEIAATKCEQAKTRYHQNPEIAARKREQARQQSDDTYKNPKKAESKRQQAKTRYHQNPEIAATKCEQAKTRYHQNPEIAATKCEQAKTRYHQNPEIAATKCEQAKTRYHQNPEIAATKCEQAKTRYHQNPEIAATKCEQAKTRYHQNPEIAATKCEQAKTRYHQNPEIAARKREQARQGSTRRYQNQNVREAKIQQSKSNRSNRNSNIESVITNFKKSCKDGQQLIYICQICQRVHFKHQGQTFHKEKYNTRVLLKCFAPDSTIDQLPVPTDKHDHNVWICNTCHQNIYKQRIVPRLATVNKLNLLEIPPELSQLNMLERHLIAPAIPFMKMISLIKGAQKGIHGQVVCVKADVNTTAKCLPRLPTDESLIRVKLKRKLEYKGHHMCQDVNPTKVKQALSWLKDNNPNYEEIDVNFKDFDALAGDELIHDDHHVNENNLRNEISHEDSVKNDHPVNEDNLRNEHIHEDIDEDAAEVAIATEIFQIHDNIIDNDNNNYNRSFHVDDDDSNVKEDTEHTTDFKDDMHEVHRDHVDHNSNDHELHSNNQEIDDEEQGENDNITNTSAPLYSFLHPVDFAQYLADKHDSSILAVAPGEGNTPQKVLEMESKSFPVEFPDGSNTYTEKRRQKLSPSRYFNSRLFSADNRFARNPEYIFFALYATEVHQIHSNVSIAIRIGSTKTSDGKDITASMLRDHEQVKRIIQRDEGYRFLTHIRGTPAYWEKSKRDLFAMIRQLGIPTFFVTFSAADRRWIEIDNAILTSQGKQPMSDEQHKNMTWEQHCDIIMSNPVAAARMFQQRVHTFINDVIMSEANPIGKVQDFYYRTEFQQRGWPHIHMVLWVENAPRYNEESEDEVIEFIDKYISCEVPPESDEELHEIVTSVQTHSKNHTKSCRKGGKVCRYNFPKPPSNRTFICEPVDRIHANENDPNYQAELDKRKEEENQAKERLKTIWELLANSDADETEWNEILHTAGITQSEFEKCLATLAQRRTPYLKRRVKDQWINNYNPHLIRCWNGNMDIQYVLDPYAVAMYIVSYITKSEREMGDLLKNAQREASEGNTDAIQQLRKLGSVYLQNREISVMGAIYLICSMPLRNSTRNVIFLQTSSDGQKISLPLEQLQANAGKSEQVWMPTQIEKYIGRPHSAKYNSMCMARFFSSHYQVTSAAGNACNSDTDDDSDETDNEELHDDTDTEQGIDSTIQDDNQGVNVSSHQHNTNKRRQKSKPIQLTNSSVKMKERSSGKAAVIRYPHVSVKKDKERYHMNMLRLYLPHRTENIKPSNYPTYENYHLTGHTIINGTKVQVKQVVEENMADFEPETDELDEAWEALRDAVDLQDAWAAINPQGEQQRLDDMIDQVRLDESDDDFSEIQIPELKQRNRSCHKDMLRCAIESCNPQITPDQAQSMMRKLNEKQRQLFNYVSKWCDDKARDLTVPPFHIFLTGGAGTGKSHVINCIKYYAQKVFSRITESADDVTVLLLAHTGTAAFNISGETICSALKIGTSLSDYKPLAEDSLNTLRTRYQHLQLVIIDEISMVSVPQLSYIHGRLQQIKGTSQTSYFGNVSILAVGDFYQLPPVCPRTPLCFLNKEILKDLWNFLFQKVELTEIMRQKNDAVFANMLNRLRMRKKDEPLQETDVKLLESRTVKENILTPPPDALHLFYKNVDVNKHNDAKIATLNTKKYTVQAEDVDQKDGRIVKVNTTPHKTSRNDNTSLAPSLQLAVGARTMLIANVDVSDGLCNGVSGIIEGIEFRNSTNMPSVVYVKFESDRIGVKARSAQFIPPQYSGCVPITPRKEVFKIKGKTYTTTRQQMPLKLAWAVTIHKVQGQTTDKAVISMEGLTAAMAYVALSRVTTLEGLYLTNYDQSKIFCNKDIEANVGKMSSFDLSTANPLLELDHNKNFIIVHHNIQSLRCHIEDLKSNTQMRNAHVICLSETWLTDNDILEDLVIDGYTLETLNVGRARGVAMYIQNSVDYSVLPILSNDCDTLAIRTYGATNMLIAVVYKPPGTRYGTFCTEMNNITAQTELLETDHAVFVGDFNIDLMKDNTIPPRVFENYYQAISEPTTSNETLLDHIYIRPKPSINDFTASVLPTYYSYHRPVFIAIKRKR